MSEQSQNGHRVGHHEPQGKLKRLGEGIGKVVYASEHWVVKRERSPMEVVALILVWKAVRKVEGWLPGKLGKRLLDRPSRQIRFLRMLTQGTMLIIPKSVWLSAHVKDVWKLYRHRDLRGERLADEYLAGTELVPREISFPPVKVKVGGWPGYIQVSEACERVEGTLYDHLSKLAAAGRFEELEGWLDRFLSLRQLGWQRGLFSLDAHMKNFGVAGDRIVLLDAGGLTNRWEEVEKRLAFEAKVKRPHVQLGLENVLRGRPEIAKRFDKQWKEIVRLEVVQGHWPEETQFERSA
jgi:hypothetical protein